MKQFNEPQDSCNIVEESKEKDVVMKETVLDSICSGITNYIDTARIHNINAQERKVKSLLSK